MAGKTKEKAIRVTHTLYRPQLRYLDKLAFYTSQASEKSVKRSIIIRVLIDILKNSKPILKNTKDIFTIQQEIEDSLKSYLGTRRKSSRKKRN